jgi:SNF2 family DNA or RNA helicase
MLRDPPNLRLCLCLLRSELTAQMVMPVSVEPVEGCWVKIEGCDYGTILRFRTHSYDYSMPSSPSVVSVIAPREGIQLLPYQDEGVRWLLEREAVAAPYGRCAILGDDMGLGKTFQCISYIKSSPFVDFKTAIICPPALVAGWTLELTTCGFCVFQLVGSSWRPVDPSRRGLPPIYITTYPRVSIHRRALCRDILFDRIILDEGHCIRNGPSTGRWSACVALADKTAVRIILSATPVQNGSTDWRNLCWWMRVKCKSGQLKEVAPVIMLRRTMAELRGVVEALPPVPQWIIHDLHVDDEEEKSVFMALCNQMKEAMESPHVSALMKLELYMRIQQFVVHPDIYIQSMKRKFGAAYPRREWTGGCSKWSSCMAILAESIEEALPSIVFCQFRTEMDMVAVEAREMGASVWSIRGGMSSGQVGETVVQAREAALRGESVVIVVQIVAGGAGLNLQFCRRVLFLSQHWNPAVVHQAVGRAVRIGQKAVVDIHCFRIVDSALDNIDLRMAVLHGVKISGAQSICSSLFEGFALITQGEGFGILPPEEQKIIPVLPSMASMASMASTASMAADTEFSDSESEDPV